MRFLLWISGYVFMTGLFYTMSLISPDALRVTWMITCLTTMGVWFTTSLLVTLILPDETLQRLIQ